MNKHFKLQPFVTIPLAIFLTVTLCCSEPPFRAQDILYSLGDEVAVKDEKGTVLSTLDKFDCVVYLGKHSSTKESINIDSEVSNDFRYLIKTTDNKEGWVFGGYLKKIELASTQDKAFALACAMAAPLSTIAPGDSTGEQIPFDCALIRDYLSALQKGQLVYSRPIYESGCLGTLEEKCFSNKILERDHEGGKETILFGFEKPLLGLTKGMSKTQVYEKLGMPARYNKNLALYQGSDTPPASEETPTMSYELRFYFDRFDKVQTLVIMHYNHEDC